MTRITLPIHTRTGLTAIGLRRDGRPIWPVMGGDGTTAPPAPPVNPAPPVPQPPAPTANPADQPLGEPGLRALQAERQRVDDLQKQLKEYEPLKELAKTLAGGKPPAGKSEIDLINERLAAQDKVIADQAASLLRGDVAREKQLTPEQAAELRGATREELTAHADRLLALFGQPAGTNTPPAPKPGMRPDPGQGARPGATPTGRDAGLAEAQKRFGKPAATTT